MKITVWKRLLRDGSGGREDTYTYRFRLHGRVHTRRTTSPSAEEARRKALAHVKVLEAGVHDQVAHLFTRRAARAAVTIGELLATHEKLGQGKGNSSRSFRQQLRNILAQAGHTAPDPLPLSTVSAGLVRAYKAAVEAAITAQAAGDARAQQMRRTANSTVSAARALFAETMLPRYRDAGLVLPDTIEGFRSEPLFPRAGRIAYRLPGDAIIAATLADLERQKAVNRNLYVAVWLILGFGLRKSELAGLRVRDLEAIRGRWHAVICETWPNRERCTTTKNRDAAPKIPVANNAWLRLAPMLEGLAPADYVLTGEFLADRLDYVARDIGAWMRGLGWKSQKTMHELRSWAICQVGYAAQAVGMDPLETMRGWARHGSRNVTEKHYGRYFSNTAPDAPLLVPEAGARAPALQVLPEAGPETGPAPAVTSPVSAPGAAS